MHMSGTSRCIICLVEILKMIGLNIAFKKSLVCEVSVRVPSLSGLCLASQENIPGIVVLLYYDYITLLSIVDKGFKKISSIESIQFLLTITKFPLHW